MNHTLLHTAYKYLGETIAQDSSLTPHILNKDNEVKAALSMINAVTSDNVLSGLNLQAIFKIVETCIIPGLLYGAEAWMPSSDELGRLQRTQNTILRRVLGAPPATPITALLIETGTLPVEALIDKRRLAYLWKLHRMEESSTAKTVMTTQTQIYGYSNNWMSGMDNILTKYNLSVEECKSVSKYRWKKTVKKKIWAYWTDKLLKQALEKKKTKKIALKSKIRRESYICHLPKKVARIIFLGRCEMLPIKEHTEYEFTEMTCRLCGNENETYRHLTMECTKTTDVRETTRRIDLFGNDKDDLKALGEAVITIIDQLPPK